MLEVTTITAATQTVKTLSSTMQDSAPANMARIMQDWLQANCPEFIKKNHWPPKSPDLNPLDYHVWSAMLEKCHKLQLKHKTIDELKVASQTTWEKLPRGHINKVVANFTERLTACVYPHRHKDALTGSIRWVIEVSCRTLETPVRTIFFRPVPWTFFICAKVRRFIHVLAIIVQISDTFVSNISNARTSTFVKSTHQTCVNRT